jgi:glycosyltransferase involved in cell wall biosynthesis
MRILILTDTWPPHLNGVVVTMTNIVAQLKDLGHEVLVISPADFKQTKLEVYPGVKVPLPNPLRLERMMRDWNPDCIHIVTEFTIGILGILICWKNKWRYTTSYHTKFPEYLKKIAKIPLPLSYGFMRLFHRWSRKVMVATTSLKEDLDSRGFRNTVLWSRGVDTSFFTPRDCNAEGSVAYPNEHRPILMYVGRVSYEKNIGAFLESADAKGTKYVVGDGPALKSLKAKYPNAIYKGMLHGKDLAEAYANADVFIFPSKTDTFGLVILEALAAGVPVVAYNVTGPKDIISSEKIGILSNEDDLSASINRCLEVSDKKECRAFAEQHTWRKCAERFVDNLKF